MNDVDKYIANIPEQARSHFDELRKLVVKQLPDVHEVLSYGVIGYKPDPKKRAVYLSAGGEIIWRYTQSLGIQSWLPSYSRI